MPNKDSFNTDHTLKRLSDDALLLRTKHLAQEERRITAELIETLREVETRRLYAREGYGSLFDFVHKGLGFSEGSAVRRVNAMRLTKTLPQAEAAITEGRVSLSNASALQMFFKREKKNDKTYTPNEKAGLLAQLENKSSRECEKILAAVSPVSAVPQERERVITPENTEIRFIASAELLAKLQKLKSLLSHSVPNQSYSELFELLADHELARIDPEAKAKRVEQKLAKLESEKKKSEKEKDPEQDKKIAPEDTAASASCAASTNRASRSTPTSMSERRNLSRTRYIPTELRRAIWLRDQGQCQHRDPRTGRLCGSRFQLQLDHIHPFSKGGASTLENLTLVCRTHNTWRAMETLGHKVMAPYLKKA